MVEVEPGGSLGDPDGRVARHQAVESSLVMELVVQDDPVDEMVEEHVLAPGAPVLRHGLVAGHQDGDLPRHVGLVQSRPLQLKHELDRC